MMLWTAPALRHRSAIVVALEVRATKEVKRLSTWKVELRRNWRGHDDVMQTRSIRGSGEPVWVIALLKCALTIGTRSAQSIMASGFTAASTGRTHDRTRPMLHQRQKKLLSIRRRP